MSKKRVLPYLVALFVFLVANPLPAENISFKFSINLNSYSDGDMTTWIRGLNTLWQDYNRDFPGSLSGEFLSPSYGSNFEFELRIPIAKGFALNLAGSRTGGSQEGEVKYVREGGVQEESQFLLNDVNAVNLKIGFSYRLAIPFLPGLHIVGNAGRHLIYVDYDIMDNNEAVVRKFGLEFFYSSEKESSFRSDALGFYAGLGFEYDVVKYVALVLEVEKTWSKADGLKGSHLFQIFQENELIKEENGKATLYNYESQRYDSPTYYPVLTGHTERPEDDLFKNLREGELDFSRFSVKLGIRFKF